MRRLAALGLSIIGVLLITAAPAAAKGVDSHAKVTISGAGLPGGIVTLGGDGADFAFGSGLWERKWGVPNIGGSLEPDVDLGPAYVVRVVLDCEAGERSRFRLRLYPNAPGGAQLYTPEGITACGAPAQPGYDPLGPGLEALLRDHGIEFHPLAMAPRVESHPASEPGSNTLAVAAIGGIVLGIAIAAMGLVRRRRRALA